jgi:hypothetical protein
MEWLELTTTPSLCCSDSYRYDSVACSLLAILVVLHLYMRRAATISNDFAFVTRLNSSPDPDPETATTANSLKRAMIQSIDSSLVPYRSSISHLSRRQTASFGIRNIFQE